MKLSAAGLQFIADFEGFSPTLYNDPGGHCTIGYGHLVHLGNCDGRASEQVYAAAPLTTNRGLALLRAEASRFVLCVNDFITATLTQHQFDALVSFAFNVGCYAFETSGVRHAVNRNAHLQLRDELERWTYSSGVQLPGLVRRRAAEWTLFTTPANATPKRPQEDDMKPFLIWDRERSRLYFVGPWGAAWITDANDAAALKRAFGKPTFALSKSAMTAIDQRGT